eukprot:scaffold306324_cov24-Tisochrysis_lutea.AAC.2
MYGRAPRRWPRLPRQSRVRRRWSATSRQARPPPFYGVRARVWPAWWGGAVRASPCRRASPRSGREPKREASGKRGSTFDGQLTPSSATKCGPRTRCGGALVVRSLGGRGTHRGYARLQPSCEVGRAPAGWAAWRLRDRVAPLPRTPVVAVAPRRWGPAQRRRRRRGRRPTSWVARARPSWQQR